MAGRTTIEWTQYSWNPVSGCTKVSPGCTFCYAERFAERFRGVPGHPYEQGFDLKLWPDRLDVPLRWRKPRMVFVNSMSDLLQERVPDEFIEQIFSVMARTPRHTYQVLTKRADRMAKWHAAHPEFWDLPNIWLGASVEDRRYGVPRIPFVRSLRAAVRFLSIEPLLEDVGELDLRGIVWVIGGGESGPEARPMHPTWIKRVRDQVGAAGIPFFFKQWGEWSPEDHLPPEFMGKQKTVLMESSPGAGDWVLMRRVGKKRAGNVLDGKRWIEWPESTTKADRT